LLAHNTEVVHAFGPNVAVTTFSLTAVGATLFSLAVSLASTLSSNAEPLIHAGATEALSFRACISALLGTTGFLTVVHTNSKDASVKGLAFTAISTASVRPTILAATVWLANTASLITNEPVCAVTTLTATPIVPADLL